MSPREPFRLRSDRDLLQQAADLHIELPFQEDIAPLLAETDIEGRTLPNRLAVQPMEGFDASSSDGSPGELTFRRYERYAAGGSGLIWFEAAAAVPEGRSNPRQLWLHRENSGRFKELVQRTREAARRRFGRGHRPFLVLQLTHSGRSSKPEGTPAPLTACRLSESSGEPVPVSDDYLERLLDSTAAAARLALSAGFDGVDIKACHGYLVHELLFAVNRRSGRFGGSFENRSRFLTEAVARIRAEVPDLVPAVRLSAFDSLPGGFGQAADDPYAAGLAEPLKLAALLQSHGCGLLNITGGIPGRSPHLVRPFSRAAGGGALPEEHPLTGVTRLLHACSAVQRSLPELPCVSSGYSWLRQFIPGVAAAVIRKKSAAFAGLGRSSFAYPGLPADLMRSGAADPRSVCLTCSICTELMKKGGPAGCAVRDRDVYPQKTAGRKNDG